MSALADRDIRREAMRGTFLPVINAVSMWYSVEVRSATLNSVAVPVGPAGPGVPVGSGSPVQAAKKAAATQTLARRGTSRRTDILPRVRCSCPWKEMLLPHMRE